MTVNAADVKKLREATGAGMMECKKALEAAQGDFDVAVDELRKAGAAKAGKKASRVAADGVIVVKTVSDGKQGAIVEVNCETDFVGRDQNFVAFANAVSELALQAKTNDLSGFMNLKLSNEMTVEETRQALVAKVGENIHIRRLAYKESVVPLGVYLHGQRIGVLVELDGNDPELAKDVAMHIAASKPLVISQDEVSKELVAKEKEIYLAQAATSGKPQEIIEKMVQGRLKKFLDEVSLLGQPFIKDPSITIANLLTKHRAHVLSFIRFEVGEGIEKEKEDFVGAVMAQVQGG